MATHDYDIANQSGAAFRTDLNNALAAIQSNNSNSSSPATTVAYQWWADTTNGVLKIRNSSNNAWVELFQLDGTLTLEDGSASTPALAFRDDLDTGIFSSAANTFNVATGGVERMELGATTIFNEDGADVDFRIEGDTNANLFYLDAGNDRIGIGTASPLSDLHIDSDGSSTTLTIESTIDGSSLFTSGIDLKRGGNTTKGSRIESIRNASAGGVGLKFLTTANNTAEINGSLSTRMTLDRNGNLMIGTTTTSLTTSSFGIALLNNGAALFYRDVGNSVNTAKIGGNAGQAQIEGNGDIVNTNNSYGQISDETLKQDIVDAASQWNDIKNIRVRKFRFKDNPTGDLQIGVVAQELETVSAGLVSMNEGVKTVKYSVLYMKAVKCLQEAIAKIETLETKVAVLESA